MTTLEKNFLTTSVNSGIDNRSRLMEYKKYFKGFLLIVLSTVVVYLIFTNHYTAILQSLNIPFVTSYTTGDILPVNMSMDNLTFKSSSSIKVPINNLTSESSSSIKEFESRISEYYPRIPIHIFTQNLSLIGNTSKLILLANGFFGERDWGIGSPKKSSTEKMTTLFCPFLSNRCDITSDYNRFSEADAVVFHLRDGIDQKSAKEKRQSNQRFVFALWESPSHTPNLNPYRQFFNWTMSYRTKSHIVTSYYAGNPYVHTSSAFYRLMLQENSTRKLNLRVTAKDHRPSDEILQKKKLGTAAALISNCGGSSRRLEFIKNLKKYMDVRVYGRCGEGCPSNMNCREFIAQNYWFILSFENSLCTEYTTEKFFAALEYPVVPVVLGRTNYSYFIPPSGYIDTDKFSTMLSLAQYLNQTRDDKEKYLSYFSWKKDYVWGFNHFFFTSFCDLCVRLHLDSKPSVIDDMQGWWDDDACRGARIPQ